MADLLIAALSTTPLPPDVETLSLTDPIGDLDGVEGIMVSGGVAEYVYHREERDFQDMGKRLGHALRRRLDNGALPWPLLPAGECIRATALGASEYSIQLSGSTSYITKPGRLLPRRNLQVLRPDAPLGEHIDPETVGAAIRRHFTAFDLSATGEDVAIAMPWTGAPDYHRIRALAEGLALGLADRIADGNPLYVMLDGDVAMTLGRILREELKIANDMLVVDGLSLWDFDYIDLGKIRLPSGTVPVTIKSLLFTETARGPRPRQRIHHHAHDHGHHGHGHDHDHHHHGHHDHGQGT
jgi:ethanolamine utilization protein EutA